MDRNQVTGFALLAGLLIAYVVYNQHSQTVYQEQKVKDSVAYATAHPHTIKDTASVAKTIAPVVDDSETAARKRLLPAAYNGTAQTITLENKTLALEFTTKGAYPVSANIKGYKTYEHKTLYLFNGKGNELSAILPIDNDRSTNTLYFTPITKSEPNGDKSIDFSADLGTGKKVDIIYTLPANDNMLRCSIHLAGMPATSLKLNWQTRALQTENDLDVSSRSGEPDNTQIYYQYKNENHDYFTIRNDDKKQLSEGTTQWVGLRKQYFSTVLIANDGANNVLVSPTKGDSTFVAAAQVSMEVPLKAGTDESVDLKWYIGANDYKILKSYHLGMEEMVPMGSGVMAFVKYINKWVLIPVFYFFGSFISNYAIIIILMTIFIRLVLSFFTYKSYLSAAKMRVMKPELDALRAQYGDDQQKFGVEQMKLYKSAGVNPLGGCLPTLFQMPFLFAMYYLFPSFIEFRQQSFLWAKDLSTYDSIASWSTNIPVISSFYGNHISLFTLLMTASSLFLALYNRNMTPQDPNNPMMKYIPYIFPFMLLGVFNKMAAALTFYYTFSNILSITQQFVIQKYFINEKAIHAKLQENKNKPATPSKWAQKLEEIQKVQAAKAKQPPRTKK